MKRTSKIYLSTHMFVLGANFACGALVCDYFSEGVILKGGRITLGGTDALIMVGVFAAFVTLLDIVYLQVISRKLNANTSQID